MTDLFERMSAVLFDPPLSQRYIKSPEHHGPIANFRRMSLHFNHRLVMPGHRAVVAYAISAPAWMGARDRVWQWSWMPVVASAIPPGGLGFFSTGFAPSYDEAAAAMRNDMDLLRDYVCRPVEL